MNTKKDHKLRSVLSVASHFANTERRIDVNPYHLFLALLALEIFAADGRESEVDDGTSTVLDLLADLGHDEECIFFPDVSVARRIFASQTVPAPDDAKMLTLLQEDGEGLPLSMKTQGILDCDLSFTMPSDCSICRLGTLAMATIGSHDPQIDGLLLGANVTVKSLTGDAITDYPVEYNADTYIDVGDGILQALANNGFEHSIPAIIKGLSDEKSGRAFGDALFSMLTLGNQIGEDCEPVELTSNWAYAVILGLIFCDCEEPTQVHRLIENVKSSLTGRKATGSCTIALTQLINALPFQKSM